MVTGSCHYLEMGGLKMLVDFGLVQDSGKSIEEIYKLNTRELPVDISEIDYVVITHGHLDHIGKLGYLPSRGFNGVVITTALTSEIVELNLENSAGLHNKEVERINKRRATHNQILPIFTPRTVDQILTRVRGYSFNQEIVLNDKVTLELLPAGHLSGASMPLFTLREGYEVKRALFTGDTSASRDIPFTKKPDLTKLKVDMIITESTYGDRTHRKDIDVLSDLEKHIMETCVQDKATLLIPAFSIGRSTNVLHYLKQIYDRNPRFENIPIFLASPMACDSHFIIGREDNFEFYDEQWKQYKGLWSWDRITYIENFEKVQSKLANGHPKIIVASSGMLVGGYSTYLASIFLPHKKSKVLISGYQGEGTLGNKLLSGTQKTVSIDGKPVKIRAKVDTLHNVSGHADGDELVEMFSKMEKKAIKKFVIVHGDEEQAKGLKKKLLKEFKDVEVIIPNYREVVKV